MKKQLLFASARWIASHLTWAQAIEGLEGPTTHGYGNKQTAITLATAGDGGQIQLE